jgi:hypothetical protein
MESAAKNWDKSPNILPEIWITPQIKKASDPNSRIEDFRSQNIPATTLCRDSPL